MLHKTSKLSKLHASILDNVSESNFMFEGDPYMELLINDYIYNANELFYYSMTLSEPLSVNPLRLISPR